MVQNGQEPVKQPGVGIGLADTEGKLDFTVLALLLGLQVFGFAFLLA